MTTYETITPLPAASVIERARRYFERLATPEAAWVEEASHCHIRLGREVGGIVIGATPAGTDTHVRGTASRGAAPLARFLATLHPRGEVVQAVNRYGGRR